MKQILNNQLNNNFRRKIKVLLLTSVLFIAYGIFSFGIGGLNEAQATVPKYINFQGKLTKVSDGTNMTNASYAFEFKLYDALTSGTLLWTETFDQPSGACGKLAVTNGVFNAKLGSCNSLSGVDLTGGSVYLSVNFAPTGTSYDGEMSPRKQLVSSAFALVANGVSGDGVINTAVQSSTALTVGRTGSNPALTVDTNTASSATGLKVTAAAAGGGLAITTISSGTDENLTVDAKGAGTISIGGTSTGNILLAGGIGSTGCTITNSNGNLACTGSITGASTGTFGYWDRTGTVLSPATAGDDLELDSGDYLGLSSSIVRLVFNDAARDNITVTAGDLLFSADNTWDIGASGATRARTIYAGTSVVAPTINATTALQVGGADINTAGTLTNVAYLNQANTFTAGQTITPAVNTTGLAVSSYSLTGSDTHGLIDLSGTWNTSGTPTAIKLNITDTASGATSFFVDLQKAGSTVFSVNKNGSVSLNGTLSVGSTSIFAYGLRSRITSPADGQLLLQNAAQTDFGRLEFGGTTSSFPSIKRSGAGLQARLADDSGYTTFDASDYLLSGTSINTAGTLTNVAYKNQANTFTANNIFQPTVTTGTGSSAGVQISAGSLTSGNGVDISSSTLTSGNLVSISSNGTAAAASQTGLNISLQGTTATNAITSYGAQISNTHANATSGTNVALQLTASGATTANYALVTNGGSVGIGTTTPGGMLDVVTSSGSSTQSLFAVRSGSATASNFSIRPYGSNFGSDIAFNRAFNGTDDIRSNNSYSSFKIAHNPTGSPESLIFQSAPAGTGAISYSTAMAILDTGQIGVGLVPTASYDKLQIQGTDATGNGVALSIRNTDTSSLSFAMYKLNVGAGSDGGVFFGSSAALDAYGIANGMTLRAGTTSQDLGFSVGNNISGTGSGPNLIVKASGNVGIGDITPASLFTVGASDAFQVNSSGAIAAVVGITNTGAQSTTVQSATALTVARTGSNYAFQVDTNTASSATGVKITSAAAAGGVAVAAISSGTDEAFSIDAKGAGAINIGNNSTGSILFAGGVGSTGCTITTAGALSCSSTIGGSNLSGTNTGDQTITLTGDVTGSGTGSFATAIGSDKILESMLKAVDTASDEECLTYEATGGDFEWQSCGSALTPWTSNIDADGYALQDALNLEFRTAAGSAPAGTVIAVYADNSGDLTANVLTGKTFNIAVNGTDEYNFSSTALALNSNNITGVGTAITATAGLTVTATAADLTLATATSGNVNLNSTGGTIELQDATNVTGALDVSTTLAVGTADAFQVASNGNLTSSNAGTWTFSNDTDFALTGGVNGLSFDGTTFSVDGSNNRIGIGIAAPTKSLDISLAVGSYEDNIRVINTNTSGIGSGMLFDHYVTGAGATASIARIYTASDGAAYGNQRLTLQSISAGGGLADTLTLKNGKIGINNTTPVDTLEVRGAWTSAGGLTLVNTAGSGNELNTILFYDSGWSTVSSAISHKLISGATDTELDFFASTGSTMAQQMVIQGTGKVGIGTTAPDKPLEVNSATGAGIRITYNDGNGSAANYSDLSVSSGGDLTIAPSGSDTNITGNLIVSSLTSGGTQCVQASSTGVLSGTGSACGSGGGTTVGGSITSGTANRVLYENASNQLAESANFTYDATTLGVSNSSTTASNKVINISQTGATSGTDYAGYFSNTGAATTNVAAYFTATGGTNNYAAIFENGKVGIGTTAPAARFDISGTDIGGVYTNGFGQTFNLTQKVDNTITTDPATDYASASLLGINMNIASGTVSGTGIVGVFGVSNTASTDGATYDSTSPIAGVYGITSLLGTGSVNMSMGGSFGISRAGTGVVTNMRGINVANANYVGAGTIADVRGINIQQPYHTAGGTITDIYGLYIEDQVPAAGTVTNTPYGIYQAGSGDYNYFAGNVGVGDASPNSLLTVGSGDLFQVNSTGQIGAQQAPVSDYLFALAGTTGNDHSRIIDITQANNVAEDSAAINIVNTANPGSIANTTRIVTNMTSQLTPTATVTASSSTTSGTFIGRSNTVDTTNITIGDHSGGQFSLSGVYGNDDTVVFSPTFNDTAGTGLYSGIYGVAAKGQLTGSPVYTNVASPALIGTIGGWFTNNASSAGNANVSNTAYGVLGEASGNLTTTGDTNKYGGYFAAGGTADFNYGIYTTVTGATTNYAAILMGGNVGIGTDIPDKALEVNSSNGNNLRLTYNDNNGSATNYADLLTTSAGGLTIQPSGFIANIGGGTTRTALRFLEPSGTGTDYAAIQSNANVTTSYTWSLPAADASGCIQSNGSGALSIAACGGGLTIGTTAITSGAANRVLFENGSNVLSEDANFTYDGTTLGVGNSSTTASNKVINISQTGATSGTDYAGYFSNTGAATANVGLYATATGATSNYAAIFDAGNVGIGTTAPTSKLTVTDSNSTSNLNKISAQINLTDSGNVTSGTSKQALAVTADITGNVTGALLSGIGLVSTTSYLGAIDGAGATDTLNLYSADLQSIYSGSGGDSNDTLTVLGINTTALGDLGTTGTTSHTGIISTAQGTADTNTGIKITNVTGATSNKGLEISSIASGATNYAIYSSAAAQSYFAGNVGIGITAATSLLHIQQAADSTSTSSPVALDVNSVGSAGELTATSGIQTFARIAPIINQSSTAGYNALLINSTETALGSGMNRLADLQVGGSTKFAVRNDGSLTLQDTAYITTPYGGFGKFQNLLVRSEEFDNASWIKTSVSAPTADAQVAPDGSSTAESLATSGSGGDVCQWSATAAGSNTFTFSIWVKAASGTQNFGLRIDAGATSCATANNVTGTEQTYTATTSWQRYEVTKTFSSATGNVKARIFPGTTGSTGTVYAWGAQLDQAIKATNYAYTAGSTLSNINYGRTTESNVAATASSTFTYGARNIMKVATGSDIDATYVADFIRVYDNDCSPDCDNTTKGLEVQAYSGTNVAGTNIGIDTYGYTFGLKATSTGQASNVAQPAAVFADLDNGSATTTGNAIRAYTDNATSATLVSVYQETSSFTGTMLSMSAGNSGSFDSGNFISLINNDNSPGTRGTVFNVDYKGLLTVAPADADNTKAIVIDTEESTATQSVFEITSDVTTNDQLKFHVEADGSLFASLTGTQNTVALCHANNGQSINDEIVDCSGAPSDVAEYFGTTDSSIAAAEVVVGGEDADPIHIKGFHTSKAWIEKTSKPYDNRIVGVISTSPAAVYGDEIFTPSENPRPVALVGRVPVKVSLENGPIQAGDYLTTSSTPGFAMKSTRPGMVIGQAISSYDGEGEAKVMVFVNPFYYDPSTQVDEKGNVVMQMGTAATILSANTDDQAAYLVDQQGSGNILQLQQNGIDRMLVQNNGSVNINVTPASEEDLVLQVKAGDTTVFAINAKGSPIISGAIFIKDDTFAGSIATDETGTAEVTFTYNLGTGKPVVQLTAEAQIPVFAQITEFKQDENGNYTGFVMKTFDLISGPIQAIVHYNVTGKQDGYITTGADILPITNVSNNSPMLIIENGQVVGGSGNGYPSEDFVPINPEDIIDTTDNNSTDNGTVAGDSTTSLNQ